MSPANIFATTFLASSVAVAFPEDEQQVIISFGTESAVIPAEVEMAIASGIQVVDLDSQVRCHLFERMHLA